MVKLWLPQAVFGNKCKIEARSEEKENPRILSMRAYQNISIRKLDSWGRKSAKESLEVG